MPEPLLRFTDDACFLATWRSLAFPVFGHKAPSIEATRTLSLLLEKHAQAVGKKRLLEVRIVDHAAPMPSSEVRDALNAMLPRLAPYYASVATLFEGTGFRGAAIRGMLRSFQLLSRGGYPQKIFSGSRECADWIHEYAVKAHMSVRDANEIHSAICFVQGEGMRLGVLSRTSV